MCVCVCVYVYVYVCVCVCVCLCVCERERERERERETDRQTDRQTDRRTDGQTDRQTQTDRHRQRCTTYFGKREVSGTTLLATSLSTGRKTPTTTKASATVCTSRPNVDDTRTSAYLDIVMQTFSKRAIHDGTFLRTPD